MCQAPTAYSARAQSWFWCCTMQQDIFVWRISCMPQPQTLGRKVRQSCNDACIIDTRSVSYQLVHVLCIVYMYTICAVCSPVVLIRRPNTACITLLFAVMCWLKLWHYNVLCLLLIYVVQVCWSGGCPNAAILAGIDQVGRAAGHQPSTEIQHLHSSYSQYKLFMFMSCSSICKFMFMSCSTLHMCSSIYMCTCHPGFAAWFYFWSICHSQPTQSDTSGAAGCYWSCV